MPKRGPVLEPVFVRGSASTDDVIADATVRSGPITRRLIERRRCRKGPPVLTQANISVIATTTHITKTEVFPGVSEANERMKKRKYYC